jgi:hypothetical protein
LLAVPCSVTPPRVAAANAALAFAAAFRLQKLQKIECDGEARGRERALGRQSAR